MGLKTLVTCLYCDEHWTEDQFEWPKTECPKCKDTNLKRREYETMDAFGYEIQDPNFKKRRST